jgi:hypothetical protein
MMWWWVVSTGTGMRCEQHVYEPDNAVAGPYLNGDIASHAMGEMARRDDLVRVISYAVIAATMVGMGAAVIGWAW